MAEVSGTITGANGVEDIVLNNAATEATLKQLLASSLMSNKQTADMIKQFAAKEGLDTSNFNEANKNIGDTGKQTGSLNKRFIDLDTVSKSLQQSFSAVTASALAGAGSFSTLLGAFAKLPLEIGEFVGGLAALYAYQESLLKSYRDLSASGANFSGSLTNMRLAAANAFMSLDHFDTLLKNNSTTLAKMGGTVNDGAIAFSRLQNNIMQGKLGEQLMGLGFSAEEVGQGMLTYINATGGRTKEELANTKEITSATGEYLVELDKLAQFTGTSRKEQEEIQKKAAVNGAYQVALSQMSEKDRAKANAGLLMAATQGKGAMEHYMASIVGMADVTEDSRKYAGMFGGAASNITNMADAAKDSSKSMKDVEKSFGSANADFVDGVDASKDALSFQSMTGNQFANDVQLARVKLGKQGADTAEGTEKLFNEITKNQKEQSKSQAANAAETELAVKQLSASILSGLMPVLAILLRPLNWFAQAISKNTTLVIGLGIAIAGFISTMALAKAKMTAAAIAEGYKAGGFKGVVEKLGIQKVFVVNMPGGGLGGGVGGNPLENGKATRNKNLEKNARIAATEAAEAETVGSKLGNGIKGLGTAVKGLSLATKLTAGGIAGELIANGLTAAGYEKAGGAADIASQALSGAAMGSFFGPWGTAIGGLLGASMGVYNNWDTIKSSFTNTNSDGSPSQQGENADEEENYIRNLHAQQSETNKLIKEQIDLTKQHLAVSSNIDKNTWTTADATGFNGYMV